MINKKTVFSAVAILFWFSVYAYVPQLSNYARQLGASYKLIGLIGGAYGLSQTILRIPLGIISDHLQMRKIFITLGIMSSVLCAILIYLFPSPYTLIIARFIAGIASATWVNFTILYISYHSEEDSNKAVGIITSNSKLGQLIGMLAGGFLAVKFGLRSVFLLSIVIGLISLCMSFFIHEEKPEKRIQKNSSSPGIMTVMKNKRVVHISLLAALLQFIIYATIFGFTPLIAADLGASNLQLGYLATLFNLPQIFFSIYANTVMADSIGQKNSVILGFIITTVICFLTPIAPNLTILYIMLFIAGIGNSIVFSLLMAMAIKGVQGHLMTTTMGFYQATFGIGMIAGPIVLGSIGDSFGLSIGFLIIGILGLAAIISSYRLDSR